MTQDYFDKFGPNAGYVAELEALYNAHEAGVPASWKSVFGTEATATNGNGNHQQNGNVGSNGHVQNNSSVASREQSFTVAPQGVSEYSDAQHTAEVLIAQFKKYAAYIAKTNPLHSAPKSAMPLDDLEQAIAAAKQSADVVVTVLFAGSEQSLSIGSLLELLTQRYAGSLSIEFDYIRDRNISKWLAEKIEVGTSERTTEEKKQSLRNILQGESFDSELHLNFLGAKRFSLSGADACSAMLGALVENAGKQDESPSAVRDIVLGMAHRGRLSTLAFFAGKPLCEIAAEFKDITQAAAVGCGDVKYHMGYSSQRVVNGKTIGCTIPPNPSHLEFVNPVAHGIVRAKQDLLPAEAKKSVLPVLIHGDASFAGQGIVCEILAYSALPGYEIGGTVHIIINNQVGFTTTYGEGHSGAYGSDMARGYDMPVLHVNGEDVEACVFATELALEYRQTFGKDIIIDLICYRRFGHNEGDDPTFTQPVMYKEIAEHVSVGTHYAEGLVQQGVLTDTELTNLKGEVLSNVKEALQASPKIAQFTNEACPYVADISFDAIPSVTEDMLREIAAALIQFPENFKTHVKLAGILKKRSDNIAIKNGIDWGLAEALAFAGILREGFGVRLSGQDCGRGTFSHRHAELHDSETDARWYPLQSFAEPFGTQFKVINSFLSESAVLGFEFGYGVQSEKKLVIWEAQFGDFCNGAQPIIDQFIFSSEAKWSQRSNVVMLLPHGFEGQGPEHSSARLERFLQMAAQNNARIIQPSTAVQYYHALRSQAYLSVKKPLIVMTPKSLLRSPESSSSLEDFTKQSFQEVIVEKPAKKKDAVLLACSGKVYFEIKKWAQQHKISFDSIAVARIEQLYPFPYETLEKELAGVSIKQVIWLQDEPENMGAYRYVAPILESHFSAPVAYVGRAASATPATGSPGFHFKELQNMGVSLQKLLEASSS